MTPFENVGQDLHVGREHVQGLVKVVHLGHDANCDHDGEEVGRRVRQLIRARKSQLQCNSESLGRHDRDRAHKRANRDVDHRCLVAVFRYHSVDHKRREAQYE